MGNLRNEAGLLGVKLLIVEDDPEYADFTARVARGLEYEVEQAFSLREARLFLASFTPHGILLDENLPDGSGLNFSREVRQGPLKDRVSILMLTGRPSVLDHSDWPQAGIDSCLPKMRSQARLSKTLQGLMMRHVRLQTRKSDLAGLEIDSLEGTVTWRGNRSQPLARRELAILGALLDCQPALLSRDRLARAAELLDDDSTALNTAVSRLRSKLPTGLRIKPARGLGYRLELHPR